MNHCRDCNSDYQTPGTCNCFAPGGKRYVSPWRYPMIPPLQPGISVKYPCPVCGKYDCTDTHITVYYEPATLPPYTLTMT